MIQSNLTSSGRLVTSCHHVSSLSADHDSWCYHEISKIILDAIRNIGMLSTLLLDKKVHQLEVALE